MRPTAILFLSSSLALSIATSALAQDNALSDCRALTDPGARLACYDGIAASAETSPAATSMPDADRGDAFGLQEDKGRSVFGRIGSAIGLGGRDEASEKDERVQTVEEFGRNRDAERQAETAAIISAENQVTYEVAHVTTFDYIKKRFFMSNGQVWEQTTGTDARIDEGPAPDGTTATIEDSGFGGFKMSLNGAKRRIKVRRVR
ncbi:MAG: hypothetical protein WBF53_02445 [Litorimonas sp.]